MSPTQKHFAYHGVVPDARVLELARAQGQQIVRSRVTRRSPWTVGGVATVHELRRDDMNERAFCGDAVLRHVASLVCVTSGLPPQFGLLKIWTSTWQLGGPHTHPEQLR